MRALNRALWLVIAASWGIAFFECCFQIPANRIGYTAGMSGAQLNTMQEVITLTVFVVFAAWYLKEPVRWNVVAASRSSRSVRRSSSRHVRLLSAEHTNRYVRRRDGRRSRVDSGPGPPYLRG